ncbi:hypothetical protein ACP0HM_26720 [Escherichia coli]
MLQTTADEAAEFTGMIPVYHFSGQCRDSGIHGDFSGGHTTAVTVTGWHCCCSYYAL